MLGDEVQLDISQKENKSLDIEGKVKEIDIHLLLPNVNQPRKNFDRSSIIELSESIKSQGILMPILVRESKRKKNKYEIIAGERRWRAAQLAKIHKVPIVINTFNDEKSSLAAIVENVQREDLNVIEEAEGYDNLISNYNMKQHDISLATGKSRSHIANIIRFIKLPNKIKGYLISKEISPGHARAILTSKNPIDLARMILDKKLNVRQTENLVKKEAKKKLFKNNTQGKDINILDYENNLSISTGFKVSIDDKNGKGKIMVEYNSLNQLEAIVKLLSRE